MNFKLDFSKFLIYLIGEREGVESCSRRKYNWFSEINFDKSLALFKRRDNDHTFKIKKSIQMGKQMALYFNRDIFLSFCSFFRYFS